VEEGILLRTAAFCCGLGYVQQDYAMKRQREEEKKRKETKTVAVLNQRR